jgi:hypothetical protein
MEVRSGLLGSADRAGGAGRADGADGLSLGDPGSAVHGDRPEVDERDGVAVGRLDREAEAVRGHGAGERHRSGVRGDHRRSGGPADVDAAVLAGRVRITPELECLQDRTGRGPRPPVRGRCEHEEGDGDADRSQ